MSGPMGPLRETLRDLAQETARAEASSRVRLSLLREVKARRRRRMLRLWMPALVAAAACLVIGIGVGRWWTKSEAPRPETARVAPLEEAPAQALPVQAVEPARGEDREVSVPAPVARRASARPVAPQAVPAGKGDRPLTPWFLYTGLPVQGQGRVVRIEVNAETAAQFGVYSTSERLPAQVFLGDDGLPRAIRFVR